ncbi:MAG: preprotein translocase subunit YajC [Ilumatobacteraceae bacterium]
MLLSSLLAAADNSSSGGGGFQIVFLALIGLMMYVILIRPQRKRMREAQNLLASIAEGDEVITSGGIYGFVDAIEGDTLWLDIADGVQIRVHRSAVARKVDPAASTATAPGATADLEDDDATTDPTDSIDRLEVPDTLEGLDDGDGLDDDGVDGGSGEGRP